MVDSEYIAQMTISVQKLAVGAVMQKSKNPNIGS